MVSWWHRIRGHQVMSVKVSPPLWDRAALGRLYECSCGKVWAK